MGIRRTAVGLGTATLLLSTGSAHAAAPIGDGWYQASRTTSAVVAAHGRTAVLAFEACSGVRVRVARPIRIQPDGTFEYTGRLVALPTREQPRATGSRGNVTVTGRFVTRTRMRASVDFAADGCDGRFTRTLRYAGMS